MTLTTYGTKIDLRDIPSRDRHPLVFNTYRLLLAGQTMELVVDHEPEHLYQEFQEGRLGAFGWDYIERGPKLWRVRIMRIGSAQLA